MVQLIILISTAGLCGISHSIDRDFGISTVDENVLTFITPITRYKVYRQKVFFQLIKFKEKYCNNS